MKTLLVFALAAFLAGCVTTPERPPTVITVEKPVPVRCKVVFPVAPDPVTSSSIPTGLTPRVVSLLHEGDAYRLYSAQLLAALRKCADDESAPQAARP